MWMEAGPLTELPGVLAPRPEELDGQVLGILDSGTPGSARFLERLTARLEKRHYLSDIVRLAKPDDRQACPPALLEQLIATCDVVVTGVGQDSEGAPAAVADAVSLERQSVPCAVLFVDDCRPAALAAVAGHGYRDRLSLIGLLGSPRDRSDAETDQLVEACFRHVEQALCRDPSAPAAIDPTAVPTPASTEARPANKDGITCEC